MTGTEPGDPDEAAITTATTVPAVTVPIPDEPDEWWTYNPELEWPVTDRDRLATENVYPHTMVSASADVANLVDQFWSWYMGWGHQTGSRVGPAPAGPSRMAGRRRCRPAHVRTSSVLAAAAARLG